MPQSKEAKRAKAVERLIKRKGELSLLLTMAECDMAAFEANKKSLDTTPEDLRHKMTIWRRDLEYVTLELDALIAKAIPLSGSAAILQRSNLKTRRGAYTLEKHLNDMEKFEG